MLPCSPSARSALSRLCAAVVCASALCACDSGGGSGAPVTLTLVSSTPTAVSLAWTGTQGSVRVERATGPFSPDPAFVPSFVTLTITSETTFTDATLTDAAPRLYRVAEVVLAGGGASSEVLALRYPRQETPLDPQAGGNGEFSRDGRLLYVSTGFGTSVYDVATGRRTGTLPGTSQVAGVLADGRVAVVEYEGGSASRVAFYEGTTRQSEVALPRLATPCEAPTYRPPIVSADGRVLAFTCGAPPYTGRAWDLAAPGAPSVELDNASAVVSALAPDGTFAIVGSSAGAVGRTDLPAGRARWAEEGFGSQFALLSPDGQSVVAERVTPSRQIALLAAADGRVLASGAGGSPISFSRDGALVLHYSARNGVQISRTRDLAPVFGLDTFGVFGAWLTSEQAVLLSDIPTRLIRFDLGRVWEVAP